MFGSGLPDLADRLLGQPENNPGLKYVWGVGIAAGLAVLAVNIADRGAYSLGAFVACLAAFVHVHCFWSQSPRLQPYAEIARELIAALLLLLIGYGLYRIVPRLH